MEKVKKPTKKDNFNALLKIKEVRNNPQLVEFISHEIELLNKKNNGLTQNQKDNEGLKEKILEVLKDNIDGMTISELIKVEGLEVSNQKANALVKQLKDTKQVVRVVRGKKATFKTIENATEEEIAQSEEK